MKLIVVFLFVVSLSVHVYAINSRQPIRSSIHHKHNRHKDESTTHKVNSISSSRRTPLDKLSGDHQSSISSNSQFGDFHDLRSKQYETAQVRDIPLNPLVTKASTASVGILFGLLIWRCLSSYELADQFASGTIRMLFTAPIIAILGLNVIGFIVNLIKPVNFKNHLKVILAINVIREWLEGIYNVIMLILGSSQSIIPREVYFGRLFMNAWWSALCISFSKSKWVLSAPSNTYTNYN